MKLFIACVITVVMESALFWIFGCRKKEDLMIVALANVITNLTLNLTIALIPGASGLVWVLLLEAAAVAAEYLIYRKAFGGSTGLFVLTFAANCLTYGTGVVLQHLGLL